MRTRTVLLVPALVVEAKAILSFFDDPLIRSTGSGLTYTTGRRKPFGANLGHRADSQWEYLIAAPTSAGNLEVARALQKLIPETKPDLVALIGCAGGFPGEIGQYDVVVATQVHYVARTKVGAETEVRPIQEVNSKLFLDHCKNVQLLDAWHQYLAPETSNSPINVHFEPIICSETVLTNSRSVFYKQARDASPKAIAIEMEGYGFLTACRDHRVEGVVVRGISDTLDDKNLPGENQKGANGLDWAQYRATRHAAALFFATLDFFNPAVLPSQRSKQKKEITKVSMVLDAEMHNVQEIQADLFEIFKKHGIKNFSFKPANSVRVEFDAQVDVLRIYEVLIRTGVITNLAGYGVSDFKLNKVSSTNPQLTDFLDKLRQTGASSKEDLLRTIRIENWAERFPDYTRIIIEALRNSRKVATTKHRAAPRILPDISRAERRIDKFRGHFGADTRPAITLQDASLLSGVLAEWEPLQTNSEHLRWFLGDSLVDQDLGVDVLLEHSKRKWYYVWPGLGAIFRACRLGEASFIERCSTSWRSMRTVRGPSILNLVDDDKWGRLGRGQIRDAIQGRPATLGKAMDILALSTSILAQNGIEPKGCVVPSIYVLMFNGRIAGGGVVERMVLTGMAGDLEMLAKTISLPLPVIKSALRGDTMPFVLAEYIGRGLNEHLLKGTKLTCSTEILGHSAARYPAREAVDLSHADLHRAYVKPANYSGSTAL